MLLAYNSTRDKKTVIVDKDIFPQTLAVLETRAKPLGIEIKMLDIFDVVPLIEFDDAFAMIVQLPNKNGQLKYCDALLRVCLLYTSPSPRDLSTSRMPSSA